MASALDTRTLVVEALKNRLGSSVRTVEAYDGPLDAGELRRVFHQSPAVLVVVLGFPDGEDQGVSCQVNCRFAAFVVAAAARPDKRGNSALAIAEAVTVEVLRNSAGGSQPKRVRAENLYNAAIDGPGLALWAVHWEQALHVDGADVTENLRRVQIDWDLAPTDEVVDASDQVEFNEGEG